MTAEVQDRLTFTGFFECTFAAMLARAIMLCGHRQDAEDAVQEAYLQALRRWDRLSGYDSAEAWVYKAMTQRLWKERRRRARAGRQDLTGDIPVPSGAGPERTAEMREVLALLASLPPGQRTALVLHCLQGLSQEEVARELGVRRGTVAASIYQARRKLAAGLGIPPEELRGSGEALMAAPGRMNPIMAMGRGGDRLTAILARVEAAIAAAAETDGSGTGPRILAGIRAEAGEDGA